jgi:hypothetical protein
LALDNRPWFLYLVYVALAFIGFVAASALAAHWLL